VSPFPAGAGSTTVEIQPIDDTQLEVLELVSADDHMQTMPTAWGWGVATIMNPGQRLAYSRRSHR